MTAPVRAYTIPFLTLAAASPPRRRTRHQRYPADADVCAGLPAVAAGRVA